MEGIDIINLVKTAKGVAAREMSLRIGKAMGALEWKRVNVKGLLETYLKEIGE